jgi:hypothetical protein
MSYWLIVPRASERKKNWRDVGQSLLTLDPSRIWLPPGLIYRCGRIDGCKVKLTSLNCTATLDVDW